MSQLRIDAENETRNFGHFFFLSFSGSARRPIGRAALEKRDTLLLREREDEENGLVPFQRGLLICCMCKAQRNALNSEFGFLALLGNTLIFLALPGIFLRLFSLELN